MITTYFILSWEPQDVYSVSKAEHASYMGPTLKLHVIEEEKGVPWANRLPV